MDVGSETGVVDLLPYTLQQASPLSPLCLRGDYYIEVSHAKDYDKYLYITEEPIRFIIDPLNPPQSMKKNEAGRRDMQACDRNVYGHPPWA